MRYLSVIAIACILSGVFGYHWRDTEPSGPSLEHVIACGDDGITITGIAFLHSRITVHCPDGRSADYGANFHGALSGPAQSTLSRNRSSTMSR